MKLLLSRVSLAPHATYGVLIHQRVPFGLTLERPWLGNKPLVSCIPSGTYECVRVNSPKFGNTFQVTNVPGRAAILFHKGNLADDSHGCILVGEQFGAVNGLPGIVASKEGFAEFLSLTRDVNQFTLEIDE